MRPTTDFMLSVESRTSVCSGVREEFPWDVILFFGVCLWDLCCSGTGVCKNSFAQVGSW